MKARNEAAHAPSLVEKNTFLSLDDAELQDMMVCRRVVSEPHAATGFQQRRRLGAGQACLGADMLLINTEDDVEVMNGVDATAAAAAIATPTPTAAEVFMWPATPEGNFLPLYRKSEMALIAEDCCSRAETTSTSSEVQDGCCSASIGSTEEVHSQECGQSWALSAAGPSAAAAVAWSSAAHVQPAAAAEDVRHSSAPMPAASSLTGRLAKAVAIAQLQELLQASENTTRFKFPPGVKVLQWSYMQKMADRVLFRGVLAFLFNGVPYHVAGDWQTCKKFARQSAADAALALLRGLQPQYAEDGSAAAQQVMDVCVDLSHVLPSQRNTDSSAQRDCVRKLESFMKHAALSHGDGLLAWDCERLGVNGAWSASLKVSMFGVVHTFTGPCLVTAEEACNELSRRILWHMGQRNARGLYIVDRNQWQVQQCRVPSAPSYWYSALEGNRVLED